MECVFHAYAHANVSLKLVHENVTIVMSVVQNELNLEVTH